MHLLNNQSNGQIRLGFHVRLNSVIIYAVIRATSITEAYLERLAYTLAVDDPFENTEYIRSFPFWGFHDPTDLSFE